MLHGRLRTIELACAGTLRSRVPTGASALDNVGDSFDSKGVKIAYTVRGQGEPVILIHGWLASGWINWDLPGISDLLAKDHQVITIDMPGHGLSDKPTKDEAYGPELVEDVVRLDGPSEDQEGPPRRLFDGRHHCREPHGQAPGSGSVGHARRHGLAARGRAGAEVLRRRRRIESRSASVSAASPNWR